MLDALVHPEATDRESIDTYFVGSPSLDQSACLGIYQRGYILRLTKCLAEQFRALRYALGDQLFDRFAGEYLRDSPSQSYTLNDLGRRFASYLNDNRPDGDLPESQRETWIDFMVELASFEWLHFSLFDAPGHEGGEWPTADVVDTALELQPCFALAQYRFGVAAYYHSVTENRQPKFPAARQCYVALLRRDFMTSTFPISPFHYHFLSRLYELGDVDQALAHVADSFAVPLDQVRESWRSDVRTAWIEAGFFIERPEAFDYGRICV